MCERTLTKEALMEDLTIEDMVDRLCDDLVGDDFDTREEKHRLRHYMSDEEIIAFYNQEYGGSDERI